MKTRFQESKIIPHPKAVVAEVYVAHEVNGVLHKYHALTKTLEDYSFKHTDLDYKEVQNKSLRREAIREFKRKFPNRKVNWARTTIWGHVYVDEYNRETDEQYIHPAYIPLAGFI